MQNEIKTAVQQFETALALDNQSPDSELAITAQNQAFDAAKLVGWDWEQANDGYFASWCEKATSSEILDEGRMLFLQWVHAKGLCQHGAKLVSVYPCPDCKYDIAAGPTSSAHFYLTQTLPGQPIWYATFDTRTGPALTHNKQLAYCFASAEQAEAQRYLYEHALDARLTVSREVPELSHEEQVCNQLNVRLQQVGDPRRASFEYPGFIRLGRADGKGEYAMGTINGHWDIDINDLNDNNQDTIALSYTAQDSPVIVAETILTHVRIAL